MGVAAYNRGSRSLSNQISRSLPSHDAQFVNELNALPKLPNAVRPLNPELLITFDHNVWWLLDRSDPAGFGIYFKNLRTLMRSFRIAIVGGNLDRHEFVAQPL